MRFAARRGRVTLRAGIRTPVLCLAAVLAASSARAQPVPGVAPPPAAASTAAPAPKDPLGRSTPRGTVLGFINAARKGENDLARLYLPAVKGGDNAADTLAHQLYVVLDARLPPRLSLVSDAPEGSRANPLAPDQEVIGAVAGAGGPVDVVVERVSRPNADPIWLFSKRTLDAVPALYDEVTHAGLDSLLSRLYLTRQVGSIRVIDWLAILLGVPVLYFLTSRLNRLLTPLAANAWRRAGRPADSPVRNALPMPARIVIVTLAGYWLLSTLPLSLLVRQSLANTARLAFIASIAWLAILLNGEIEHVLNRRLAPANRAAIPLVRVARRTLDAIWLFVAVIATLRYFGVDPTPVLAGLGVGGIAVALAAQKTLENIIAGASLILDKAVRDGDVLKVGDIVGTVEHIGLRSTRIRTQDRTVVTVPNSQIANMSLETLSARDKFWFRPLVSLRYETTPGQLHAVIDGIDALLRGHPLVERESARVRLLKLGTSSYDIEAVAYVYASDWTLFLKIQEELLFSVSGIIAAAGAELAYPSQTMYLAGGSSSVSASLQSR
jgi:MscS family membrane protein